MSLYGKLLREWQRNTIMLYLLKHRGNASAAARELGVHRNTVDRIARVVGIKKAKR